MAEPNEREYFLGTHDEELVRLGVQHRVWRPSVLDCWQRAGITTGWRVMDIGAGPGYATIDLAEIVGASGTVFAVERSARFLEALERERRRRELTNIRSREMDLGGDRLEESGLDATWCRWVACFVPSPEALVAQISGALRPGGVAIFHEYADYGAWRLAPRRPVFESFVETVISNWRRTGGEPDVGLALPQLLTRSGFTIRQARPLSFAVRPRDFMWQWPASFVYSHLDHLQAQGDADRQWIDSVRRDLDDAARTPETLMITPTVLEIIAELA